MQCLGETGSRIIIWMLNDRAYKGNWLNHVDPLETNGTQVPSSADHPRIIHLHIHDEILEWMMRTMGSILRISIMSSQFSIFTISWPHPGYHHSRPSSRRSTPAGFHPSQLIGTGWLVFPRCWRLGTRNQLSVCSGYSLLSHLYARRWTRALSIGHRTYVPRLIQ